MTQTIDTLYKRKRRAVSHSCTSAWRVLESLTHHEPDRVPLDIGGTRISGIHVEAYQEYRKAMGLPPTRPPMHIRYLQLPKIDEDFRELLGVDLESVDPDTAAEDGPVVSVDDGLAYEDRWGCEWYMPKGSAYYDVRRFPLAHVESPQDLKSYRWPNEKSEAVLSGMADEAEGICKDRKRAVVLGRTSPGILEMTWILCGYEKALTDIAVNPDLTEAIMDKILELKLIYYREAIRRLEEAGVGYFIVSESDDLGGQNGLLISLPMYRKFVKPRHTALFQAIKEFSHGAAFIEHHCCGAIREVIPDLIESGVQILNPVQVNAAGMDDTRALKKDFGDSLVFHGGAIDTQHTLVTGTRRQIRDEVKRRMDDLSPGGGFIFTPVHSIQHDVPYENFLAMMEAFEEFA